MPVVVKTVHIWYVFSMKRGFFFSLAIFILIFSSITRLEAQNSSPHNRFSWFAAGSIFFFPENNGIESDSMPILPSPGAGFGMSWIGNFRLEFTADIYFAVYGYSLKLNRAVPRAWENRSALVWGNVLGAQAAYFWDLRPNMTLRFYGGPVMDIRLVFTAPNLKETNNPMDEIKKETSAITKYFWSGMRWLLPMIGTGMDFNLNEKFRLGFDIRVWFPMYKIWTNENLPAIEGWRFGVGARVTFL